MKKTLKHFSDLIYKFEQKTILPVVIKLFPPEKVAKSGDVLHVSYLTTKPMIICRVLKKAGVHADFMAFTHFFSKSRWLKTDKKGADFLVSPLIPLSCFEFFGEVLRFYRIVLKYRVIHCHFLRFPSRDGWELPILKKIGTGIVIHYRGCDIRDKKNTSGFNACRECSYNIKYCKNSRKEKSRKKAKKYGNLFLVTTPDLLDFSKDAEYFPFFAPLFDPLKVIPKRKTFCRFEIVHATNHEGIDGTKYVVGAVEKLRKEGFDIGLNIIKHMPYYEAMCYYKGADMAIGKLMMGFYANFQIESMMLGTPTACYIREDLQKYLQGLEIINIHPDNIFEKLRNLLEKPNELRNIGVRQQQQIKNLHNNDILAERLVKLYEKLS